MVFLTLNAATPQPQRAGTEATRSAHRDYQVPAGTYLQIELRSALSSNANAPGDPVDGRLRAPLVSEGVELVPAGAAVLGTLRLVESAGKRQRGGLVFAFHAIEHPETGSLATIKGDQGLGADVRLARSEEGERLSRAQAGKGARRLSVAAGAADGAGSAQVSRPATASSARRVGAWPIETSSRRSFPTGSTSRARSRASPDLRRYRRRRR
jgi:hypothetical protein